MRMTTKGRYALRAAIALARASDGAKPISIKTISEIESISPEFLEQIFFKLRKAGIIASVRGPGGGFFFARPLSSILLKDIVTASGEDIALASCAAEYHAGCGRERECAAGTIWREFHQHIDSFLVSMNLEQMAARVVPKA